MTQLCRGTGSFRRRSRGMKRCSRAGDGALEPCGNTMQLCLERETRPELATRTLARYRACLFHRLRRQRHWRGQRIR